MRGRSAKAAAVVAAALIVAGAAQAQVPAPMFVAGRAESVRSLTSEQKQERQFLRDTAGHLRLMHAASKLALEKSANGRVRELAAAMLNQANVMQPEVQYLLHARGMAMPMWTNEQSRVLKALKQSAGTKFDRIYLDEVALRAGQQDAVRFERIATVTRDPQLQGWIGRHLPTLRYHVMLAGRQPTSVMGASPGMVTRPQQQARPPSI
ncbi:DUF4142 domain-containing protein [Ramlibacter albus]|uniref:DUF4142 domain-containing protein n=1 Tax=Ramlibacter albus TaxID=2079448 RepID=A0A923MCD8_9BURK|nr:DUF4142 domain-containing protein [Ramlibacter albus]MBC5766828.1 DUF4142 domain-containing protein [Ramlibacter albus]